MKGVSEVRECIELRSAFQNYTTFISSTKKVRSPHKLNHRKQMQEVDQKLKINLEWPKSHYNFLNENKRMHVGMEPANNRKINIPAFNLLPQ